MIGLILAAGKGSRLGELTMNTPKSLLPLHDGFTILDYNIQLLQKYNISSILIVTGFGAAKIENHVYHSDIKTIFNPFWNHCNVLGSLYMALPYITNDFIFMHSDTLIDESILRELLINSGGVVLPYKVKECGDEEMKIRTDSKGNIVQISKLIKPSDALGEFLGVAKFSKKMVPFFQNIAEELFKSNGLNQYMEDALQVAIDKGIEITLHDIGQKNFIEVDFPSDYELAKRMFTRI